MSKAISHITDCTIVMPRPDAAAEEFLRQHGAEILARYGREFCDRPLCTSQHDCVHEVTVWAVPALSMCYTEYIEADGKVLAVRHPGDGRAPETTVIPADQPDERRCYRLRRRTVLDQGF